MSYPVSLCHRNTIFIQTYFFICCFLQTFIVLCVVAWIGIIIWTALKLRGSDSYALLGAIGSMLAILFYVVLYNRMMVYVENHAYRATPDKETETKN